MRRAYLIYGPPCAGKTTHVQENAKPGDIIIDFDQLAQEAGSPKEHGHEHQYIRAASQRRLELEAQVTNMTTGTAWIIRTLGNPDEREQAAERLQAELTRIDPGGAECIRRARATGRPATTDEQIIRWYANDWNSRALTHRTTGGTARTSDHPGLK